jgi:hypothetical protein
MKKVLLLLLSCGGIHFLSAMQEVEPTALEAIERSKPTRLFEQKRQLARFYRTHPEELQKAIKAEVRNVESLSNPTARRISEERLEVLQDIDAQIRQMRYGQ